MSGNVLVTIGVALLNVMSHTVFSTRSVDDCTDTGSGRSRSDTGSGRSKSDTGSLEDGHVTPPRGVQVGGKGPTHLRLRTVGLVLFVVGESHSSAYEV